MKILKRKFVAIILAAAALFAGIFTVGWIPNQKAGALAPGYKGEPETIYYFTDYYQTVTYKELKAEFGSYHILYDRQTVNEQEFADMVYNGYFEGFNFGTCVVIIDIKTFKPDSCVLYELFSDLQQNQGCITAFVTIYSKSDYTDTTFLDYVNIFINDWEMTRLKNFLNNAFIDLVNRNGTINSTAYLIDSYLVDVNNFYGADINTLCNHSLFLQMFLKQLYYRFGGSGDPTYEEIANLLRDYYSVKLLVYLGGAGFVDILTWQTYSADNTDTTFTCAFGFWKFTDSYYTLLNLLKGAGSGISPIYALLVDPICYDPLGLDITTNSELGAMYGYEWNDDAAERLLYELHQWIG